MSFTRQRSPHDLANLAFLAWSSLESTAPAYTGKFGASVQELSRDDSTTPESYLFDNLTAFCNFAKPAISNQRYGIYCCGSRETFHDQRSLTTALHKLEIVIRDPYRWLSDFPVAHVVPTGSARAPEAIGDPDILVHMKVNALDGAPSQALRLGGLCRHPPGRSGETLPTFSDMLQACQALLHREGHWGFIIHAYGHMIPVSDAGA